MKALQLCTCFANSKLDQTACNATEARHGQCPCDVTRARIRQGARLQLRLRGLVVPDDGLQLRELQRERPPLLRLHPAALQRRSEVGASIAI